MRAGLDFARGRFVVLMHADLQDPPELIPEMLALAHSEGGRRRVRAAHRERREPDQASARRGSSTRSWGASRACRTRVRQATSA